MRRITVRDNEGFAHARLNYTYLNIIDRLAEYEDLEEKELLVKLPLKVGDKFWEIQQGVCYPRYALSLGHCIYVLERLGKICFLTEEEAQSVIVG